MTDSEPKKAASTKRDAREDRLAQALRANLRRRKAQSKERAEPPALEENQLDPDTPSD